MRAQNFIKKVFTLPEVRDEEQSRIARLLLTTIPAVVATSFVIGVLHYLLDSPLITAYLFWIAAIGGIGIFFFLKKGYIRLTGWLFTLLIWTALMTGTVVLGGMSGSVAYSGILVVIVIAFLVLGSSGGFIFYGITAILGFFTVYLETSGRLPQLYPPEQPWESLNTYMSFLIATTLFMALAVQNIKNTLRRFRETKSNLRERERNLQQIIDHMQEGLYRTNMAGEYLLVNPSFISILECDSENDLLGKNLTDLDFGITYSRDEFLTRLTESGTVKNFQTTWTTRNDREVVIRENAQLIRDEQGEVLYIQGTIEDITEQQRLEQQLFQAQKMESLGHIAGGIAHDFNNVMTVISNSLQLMQTEQDEQTTDRLIDIGLASIERGQAITNRMLTFIRSADPVVKSLHLREFIEEIGEIAQHTLSKDIKVQVIPYDGHDMVKADRSQLQQVVLNLCINAADAMPYGGIINLGIRMAKPAEFRQRTSENSKRYLCLIISDSGIGMDQYAQEKIFEPFFTTKERGHGTGLGLAVAYKIIQNHGGWIDVQSKKMKGTTFTIGLPQIGQDTAIEHRPETIEKKLFGDGERILLVEDEPYVRELLEQTLRTHGYKVHAVEDGKTAQLIYSESPDRFDLVLTDLGLPDMNGVALVRQLRQHEPSQKIVATTGYVDHEKQEAFRDQGFQEVISKPYDIENILDTIYRVLNG